MRLLILILMLPFMAHADDREEIRTLLDKAYRLPEVREFCQKDPEGTVNVTVDGNTIPVECVIWHRWDKAEKSRAG